MLETDSNPDMAKEPEGSNGRPHREDRDSSERPTFEVEKLEPRILLSATWVDADTGDALPGATEGDDVFTGDNADDVADALGGDDRLFGGQGDDRLSGGAGNDVLYGDKHRDILDGGTGDDELYGGFHDDVLISGGGNDFMDGGKHDDTFRFDGAQDGDVITVDGGENTDTIDLSQYSADKVSDDGSTIQVDLGNGESFTINYTNVENVITGAAEPEQDSPDLPGTPTDANPPTDEPQADPPAAPTPPDAGPTPPVSPTDAQPDADDASPVPSDPEQGTDEPLSPTDEGTPADEPQAGPPAVPPQPDAGATPESAQDPQLPADRADAAPADDALPPSDTETPAGGPPSTDGPVADEPPVWDGTEQLDVLDPGADFAVEDEEGQLEELETSDLADGFASVESGDPARGVELDGSAAFDSATNVALAANSDYVAAIELPATAAGLDFDEVFEQRNVAPTGVAAAPGGAHVDLPPATSPLSDEGGSVARSSETTAAQEAGSHRQGPKPESRDAAYAPDESKQRPRMIVREDEDESAAPRGETGFLAGLWGLLRGRAGTHGRSEGSPHQDDRKDRSGRPGK